MLLLLKLELALDQSLIIKLQQFGLGLSVMDRCMSWIQDCNFSKKIIILDISTCRSRCIGVAIYLKVGGGHIYEGAERPS